jgi:hypothetical protein
MQNYDDFTFPPIIGKIPTAQYAQKELELDRKINGDPVTLDMIRTDYFLPKYDEVIERELQRTLEVWEKEKKDPKLYTLERKKELVEHAGNILTSIGARFKNNTDYKTLMNHWLYEYNSANNTNYSPYTSSVLNDTSVVMNMAVSTADLKTAFAKIKQMASPSLVSFIDAHWVAISTYFEDYIKENGINPISMLNIISQMRSGKIKIDGSSKIAKIKTIAKAQETSQNISDDEEIVYTQENQMAEDNGMYYNDFINKVKSLNVQNTVVIRLYDIQTKDGEVNVDLEVLYKTTAFTIQVQNAVGKYGFKYKQIVITPNENNTKNDVYLQLYDLTNQKVQDNRVKIIT